MPLRKKLGLNSLLLGVLVTSIIGFSSISSLPKQTFELTKAEVTAANLVQQMYQGDLNKFNALLDTLSVSVKNGQDTELIKRLFLDAREQYKRSEFLLGYFDNNFTRKINGPNVMRAEGYPKNSRVIEPHGLQVMEELIYDDIRQNKQQILKEIAVVKGLIAQMQGRKLDIDLDQANSLNAVIWDALKLEVFRIESLGITGYDVPFSENAIPETIQCLSSMVDVIGYYETLAGEKESGKLYKKGLSKLTKAITFCEKNTDFDSFDRIKFCRDHLHEIGAWINEMTDALDVKLKTGVRPFNSDADHIFAEDFFNINYFLKGYTDEKAALGRKLFFDPVLSKDGSRSCATCHDPDMFFSDRMDKNFNLQKTDLLKRNTPGLYNAIWQTRQFYDSRVHNLEEQAFAVIHNEQEMAGNLKEIAVLLNKDEAYSKSFHEVYGNAASPKNISHAVASYVATLTSGESRFDYYIRKDFNSYSKEEKNGFNLFMGKAKCATCHFPPMFNGLLPPQFVDTESENIGTPVSFDAPEQLDGDLGLYEFSKLDIHKHFFKTPTVRNSNMSAPLMHNGSFPNIRTVLEFYNNGGGAGQGALNPNQTLPADSLHLTGVEIFELISFIRSLEDDTKR